MGATSNESKQRWNREHYALLKAYVSHETAAAFKSRCREDGVSVSGRIGELIIRHLADGLKPKEGNSISYAVNTRAMRRKAVAAAVGIIEMVLDAGTDYMDNIPINLQNSQPHDAAEQTMEALVEALGILCEAYQ
ncbi:MAG: hypothetical protein FWG53_00895 [Clostridiales bacterium]|nr:hypothetical protein [Clostridiales bacterium]